MKNVSFFRYNVAVWVLVPALAAGTSLQAQQAGTSGWLGWAYVDMNHGFSIRPPVGSVIVGKPDHGAEGALPEVIEWNQLKLPESKFLVAFSSDASQQVEVYLLVTRRRLSLEALTKLRDDYWAAVPGVPEDRSSYTSMVQDRPALMTEMTWPGGGGLFVRDCLVQVERDRYFLARFTAKPNDDAQPSLETMADIVCNSFKPYSKEEIGRRWQQAREQAEVLLGTFTSKGIHELLTANQWYRLFYQGKEVGYLKVEEKMQPLPEKQHAFIVRQEAYIDESEAAGALFTLLGMQPRLPEGNGGISAKGSVLLEAEYALDGKLDAEHFRINLSQSAGKKELYCAKGHWQGQSLGIQDCEEVKPGELSVSDAFSIPEAVSKTYLPQVLNEILFRQAQKKVGAEFVFVRYLFDALGFYPVRIAAQVELNRRGSEQAEDGEKKEASIKAWYVVGQLNTKGGIIEYWLDEDGRTLRCKRGQMELIRSNRGRIASKWPDRVKPEPAKTSD